MSITPLEIHRASVTLGQPRSGERMQPTALAVGNRMKRGTSPSGAKDIIPSKKKAGTKIGPGIELAGCPDKIV
jgi:hypothetical protein